MSVKLRHDDTPLFYFCTFTCYQWLPLFSLTNSYDTIYKWFYYLKSKRIETTAYVIMPNHVHLILYFANEGFDLNKVIGNAKRFMAYEIIRRLKGAHEVELLARLSAGVSEREKKKGQLHKMFEESFDAKGIYSEAFFNQKMDYIYHNPVSGKWNLVADYIAYEHSSALFYEKGVINTFMPFDYRNL